jgi:DNA-binding transcriptional regulator YiaG
MKFDNCPVCDSVDIKVAKEDLTQDFFGLSHVLLTNVKRISCDDCGSSALEIPKQGVLIDQIRRELCWLGRPLHGAEFAFLRSSMDFSGKSFASAVGVTNVTISRWEKGKQSIPSATDILIRVMTLSDLGYRGNISELMYQISQSDQIDVQIDVEKLASETDNVVSFFKPTATTVEADFDFNVQSNTALVDSGLSGAING